MSYGFHYVTFCYATSPYTMFLFVSCHYLLFVVMTYCIRGEKILLLITSPFENILCLRKTLHIVMI